MHSYTTIYNLIEENDINAEKVKVIFYDAKSEKDLLMSLEGVESVFSHELLSPHVYENAQTVNILSLSSVNAEIIYKLLSLELFNYEQLIIRITDDEVDRWHKLYKAHGKLIADDKLHVDQFTLAILEKAYKFMCLYEPWGRLLEEILSRELVIYNTNIITNKYLNNDIQESFQKLIKPSILEQMSKQNVVRILVYTKAQSYDDFYKSILPDLKKLILSHANFLQSRTLEVVLWWPSIRYLPKLFSTIMTISLLARYKKVRIKYTFLNNMPREVYFALLSSVHILIAQDRGGLGGIYEAIQGGSIIAVRENSLNSQVLSNLDGLFFVNYNNNQGAINTPLKLLSDNGFESLNKKQSERVKHIFHNSSETTKHKIQQIYK